MITPPNSGKNKSKSTSTPAKKTVKPTPAQMNAIAALFNQGRLAECEPLATKITQQFPQDGFGWKVLGAIRQQQGLVEPAFDALKMAAALLSEDSEAQYNLANYFYDQNQLPEAVNSYQAAIKINTRFAQAHYNLGSVFKGQGLLVEAEACYKTALKISPDNAQMHFNLALMLYEQGRFSEAVDYFKVSIKIQPDFTAAHVNLGASFKALGQLQKAETCYRQALSLSPDHAEAHNNLGVVLKVLGNMVEAERCYRTVIALRPEYSSTYNNLGLLLKDLGRLFEAESCYMTALKLDPLLADAHNNLSVLFRMQGRFADAATSSKNALKINPNYVDAYDNLGLALDAMGMFAEAEVAFEHALKLAPDNIVVLSNFSITLNTLCQLTRAEAYLKKCLKLAPEFINAHVNLCVNYLAQGRVEEAEATCINALKIEPDNVFAQNNLLFSMNYLATHSIKECVDKAREYGYVVASKVETPFTAWCHKTPTKRLRVGLVSGDLRQHAVAFFLENLLQHSDTSRVEFFAYPTTSHDDAMTARLKSYCSGWKSLTGLNDEAAATLIHHDGLHVLLDLSGHSSGNRLPMFAWKPAPLQVSWLGYFATTGLAEMDYFIADEVGVSTKNQSQFVEKIKYLPDTRLCFTAPEAEIPVAPLPALANGYITFGCFQNMAKVSDEVLELWAEVIRANANAKFCWQCKSFRDNLVADSLKQRLVQRGVQAENIILLASADRDDYLAAHKEVDFILDTFPFPGGTTTCEALWMGVPTLTLAGNTLISRQGASLLTAAGLGDWVANSKAEYLDKSSLFCSDFVKLSNLRNGLRAQVLASPLFDGPRFAKNMEQLLWQIWDVSHGQSTEATTTKSQKVSALAKVADEKPGSTSGVKIQIISATKLSEDDFWAKSALGLSLKRHLKQDARLAVSVAFNNVRGLSEIFNKGIDQADDDAVLIFMHDDVWVDEANFVDTVIAGLEHFDVIGVAGNLRRVAYQPAWAFVDVKFTWDDKSNLSGCIAHGKNAFSKQTFFGETPAACELLDGVFIACKKSRLTQKKVQFDPQFDFHFYDMDFCRSARQAGLKLGTWQIKLTHQSAGAFGSQHWMNKYKLYLNKWEAPSANNKMIYSEDEITQTQELQMAMNDVLQMAVTHQNTGNIEQAKNLYLEIIDIQPRHAEANHNLGVIEAHTDSALVALPRLEIAVQAKPDNEQYWVSYIDALMQSGATDSAADALVLGQEYGLKPETAQILAAEFVSNLEAMLVQPQSSGDTSAVGIHIHQIYYSEQTQGENDSGFIGLDNLSNSRPDWREYWPMRNYLLNNSLNEDDYYGFLSPKFESKTHLSAATVHEFIRAHADETDVFLFNPFFEIGALSLNIFQQGMEAHSCVQSIFKDCVADIWPEIDIATLVMDSRNIVYCNYFVAKPAFWRVWLESCEFIFPEAEANKSKLGVNLNAGVPYDKGLVPSKVFIIERVASLLLCTQRHWKVKAYDSSLPPYASDFCTKYLPELLEMDALKIASADAGNLQYLGIFLQLRQKISEDLDSKIKQPFQYEISDLLPMALAHQRCGEVEQAKNIYLEIIDIQPLHAEANHNLGVIEANAYSALIALPRLEIAVQEKPENEQYWVSYIDALVQSGATDSVADALELGQKYGLSDKTAKVLATELIKQLESQLIKNQELYSAEEIKPFCPVCGASNGSFTPLPSFYCDNALKHGYAHFGKGEMTAQETYSCSSCGASDRERLYAYWIDIQFKNNGLTNKSKIIHFAPEAILSGKLRKLNLNHYYTADLMMASCDYKVDLMQMPFEDESYDFFICSHVLEHVESDDKAITELYRILKKDGFGILMAPIALGLEHTLEDASVKDEASRWKFYGQNDHVRLYAHDDYVHKIRSHGFQVDELDEQYFGEEIFQSLGLKPTTILYVVRK